MRFFLMYTVVILNVACSIIPKAIAGNGLDTFGSKRISASMIESKYGKQIEEMVAVIGIGGEKWLKNKYNKNAWHKSKIFDSKGLFWKRSKV